MGLSSEQFFSRKTVWKATWLTRLLLVAAASLLLLLTGRFWLVWLGESLIHNDEMGPVDLIVIEDFEGNYWLYRIAAQLRERGLADRVVLLTDRLLLEGRGNRLIAEVARLSDFELLESEAAEPIALGTAVFLKEQLAARPVSSMIVVTMGFRSKRTHLVFSTVFGADVKVLCRPVLGPRQPDNWWHSWHGIQSIALEFVKLQYYRFWVL